MCSDHQHHQLFWGGAKASEADDQRHWCQIHRLHDPHQLCSHLQEVGRYRVKTVTPGTSKELYQLSFHLQKMGISEVQTVSVCNLRYIKGTIPTLFSSAEGGKI